MKYIDYLQSKEWRAKTDAVLKRDRGECRRCGEAARDVHHLTYDRVFCEDLNDLVSLCRKCHQMDHGKLGGFEGEKQNTRQVAYADRRLAKSYR